MLAVISPAKSLDFSSPLATQQYSQPSLLPHSKELMTVLRGLSPAEIASLMKLSDKLALLNCERFNDWQLPFSLDNARQALLAFSGDVYTGLEARCFSKSDFEYAQSHLRILSGLYGLLKPLDLIQAYRLEMGTQLANERGSNLYQFWQGIITDKLNEALSEQGCTILVNLASNEYFKSINHKKLKADIVTPVFKDYKNGQYKIISFYAKKARGMMAKYIIQNKITTMEGLAEFNDAGYFYCQDESSHKQLLFKRDV